MKLVNLLLTVVEKHYWDILEKYKYFNSLQIYFDVLYLVTHVLDLFIKCLRINFTV
jgi:hypothetical protein